MQNHLADTLHAPQLDSSTDTNLEDSGQCENCMAFSCDPDPQPSLIKLLSGNMLCEAYRNVLRCAAQGCDMWQAGHKNS